jgi:hypothetical protein
VIATFIALYAAGFTLNYMTLMARRCVSGLLIDDAIVVRENIVRHIHLGKDHYTAAREGTDEIGLAVLATTLSIVAVFVPIAFMSGIIGKFFFPFGITVRRRCWYRCSSASRWTRCCPRFGAIRPKARRNVPSSGRVLRLSGGLLDHAHDVYGRAAAARRSPTARPTLLRSRSPACREHPVDPAWSARR